MSHHLVIVLGVLLDLHTDCSVYMSIPSDPTRLQVPSPTTTERDSRTENRE